MSVEGLLSFYGSISNDLPESLTYSVGIVVAVSLIVRIIVTTIIDLGSPAFINPMRAFFIGLATRSDPQHNPQ